LRAVDIHMWAVGRYEGELVKLDGDWLIANSDAGGFAAVPRVGRVVRIRDTPLAATAVCSLTLPS
jgi:hypothetical protein